MVYYDMASYIAYITMGDSQNIEQTMNSQKTLHSSPLRVSYGVSFVSIMEKNDHVLKRFDCIWAESMVSAHHWPVAMLLCVPCMLVVCGYMLYCPTGYYSRPTAD